MEDARLTGFANRAPLRDALAWIDAHIAVLGTETIQIDQAVGRVLAGALASLADRPSADRVGMDGYAMRAADSEGASDYDPVTLALAATPDPDGLPPGFASLAIAGNQLPDGADAILPFEAAQRNNAGGLDVLGPVARGSGVARRGSEIGAGSEAIAGRRRLRPWDIALLAALGTTRVGVVRRPRVRVVVMGPKADDPDALTPMLRALIVRDGGTAETVALADAAGGADLVLVAGRGGTGIDDTAALMIAAAGGRLDLHGIAMRPGDSAGLGVIGGATLMLLPGAPLACLAAYDMLAGRAIRRMAGFRGSMEYRVVDGVLDRKIVSAIGFTDLARVRMAGGCAVPMGSPESGGLAGAVRADGFVIVAEASEGHAPGSSVRVHLYDARDDEDGA